MQGAYLLVLVFISNALGAPQKLIIDTDIGGGGCNDVDDVGAICIANALADNGEAEILAIVQNTSPEQCAGAISVLNHFYGRDSVPIGAYKGTDLQPAKPLPYVPDIVDNWPSPIKNTSQVPSSVTVYRQVLSAQPDHSVAISSIGLLTNLAALLRSGPDNFSTLTGSQLIERKVSLLAVMGGKYPSSDGQPECNLCGGGGADHEPGSAASGYVFSHWPPSVKILFSGFEVGVQIKTGGRLSSCAPASNPCRQAYINYEGGPNKSRYSWDPLTTLIAVRGADNCGCHECTNCDGTNSVDGQTGDNTWIAGPPSNQTYIILDDGAKAGTDMDDLLCQVPLHPPPTPPTPPLGDWAEAKGLNCYGTRDSGATTHGATDLESPVTASCGVMTLQECQRKCLDLPGCIGVTIDVPSSSPLASSSSSPLPSPLSATLYNCYRKSNISLAHCDAGTHFDTWVLASWVYGQGENCYGTRDGGKTFHGATDLESPVTASCGIMELDACKAKCQALVGCTGVTVSAANGNLVNCYRKAGIAFGECDHETEFDTWLMAHETRPDNNV